MKVKKHRRVLFILIWLLLILVMIGTLSLSVYQLYQEAEKAQKTAFTGQVLLCGKEISDTVNSLLNSEFLSDAEANLRSPRDFVKRSLISINGQPQALIAETVADYQGTIVILDKDTTYFNAEDHPEYVLVDTTAANYSTSTDSIIAKISRDTVRNMIREVLVKHNLDLKFDFCIYNFPSGSFSMEPRYHHIDILNSGYVFALKTNNSEVYTHYLILNFPDERGYFLRSMMSIVLPIVGLIVLIAVMIVIMIVLLSQQRRNQEVKTDFINNMTHEFKTPLATISLACEAMNDESIHTDADASKAYISIIKDENDRLQKMVTNILQLARLKKGQLNLEKEEINVHEMLQSICKNISLQVSNSGGEVVTNLKAANSVIVADKSHMEAVLVNIIENALKYTPEKPLIEINTGNSKGMFVVSISDNGIGISKKNIKHIFDEFYRVTRGNIHDAKGYGLGLNYVKKIVDLHGGRITVSSELKRGSIFTIYLPLR